MLRVKPIASVGAALDRPAGTSAQGAQTLSKFVCFSHVCVVGRVSEPPDDLRKVIKPDADAGQ